MTVLGHLLAGHGPAVLQTCRLEGLGGALYGREEITDALAALAVGVSRLDLETPRSGFWMDETIAVFADLIDGHVQRLWVMSDRTVLTSAPAIDVPSDPDLRQAVRGVRFDPSDHHGLEPRHAAQIGEAAMAWSIEGMGRVRPLVLRAASMGDIGLALLRLEAEDCDRPGIRLGLNSVLIVNGETVDHRLDEAGRRHALNRVWGAAF